jgi:lipopolysaccharide-induced tumor necrosis factor-alpha factor
MQRQTQTHTQTHTPPKPYSWASPSSPLHEVAGDEPQQVEPIPPPPPIVQTPSHTIHPQPMFSPGYRCPHCGTTAPPQIVKKISDGGWIVFVVMLLFCFPLFWIGLLMKEESRVCSMCLTKLG